MPQYDVPRKTTVVELSGQLQQLLIDTETVPATNPLQSVVDDLQGQLLLRTQQRDDAIAGRQMVLDQIAGLRSNMQSLLDALPVV